MEVGGLIFYFLRISLEFQVICIFLIELMFVFLQVKEYCPLVFRNLRKRFGIDDATYLKSLTKAPLPMEPPTGRSGGAKFYTSQDHIYTIKTLTSEQVEQMHLILKHYHPYIVERHGKTLLPQILVRHLTDSLRYFLQFSSKKF